MPQSQPWKQSGYSEMQLMQQQVMLKQLQEMQRQQQFQSFADMRHHSAISSKSVEGAQCSPIINGTPVHNASNMFTNWGQHGAAPPLQGMSQLASSHELRSTSDGETIQQYDRSSYDSPAGSKAQQQPVAHSIGFTHSFSAGQNLDSSNQAFPLRHDYSSRNAYAQIHQKMGKDNTFGSFEQSSSLPKNAMAYEINENEQGGWDTDLQGNKSVHISPSQGSATLDPLEEKILFNTDDNPWDILSGKSSETGAGNTGLGGWSALMQSALAETSSSDTGMQEEWSGLTFQNTDPSADNQTSNFVESGHQPADCVENNLRQQPPSGLSANEYRYLNNSDVHFSGFHQAVATNNTDFWSFQKVQSGTSSPLPGNNFSMNNCYDTRTSLVSPETQNQESNHHAFTYHASAADASRDNVKNQALDGAFIQSNSNASELSSKGRSETNMPNASNNSMMFQASNMGAQRSQNMLQLLHNINQSRGEGSLVSQGLKTVTAAASEAQYHNQSASKGYGLPPMQASQNSWQKNAAPATSSSVPHPSQIQWQQVSRSGVGSQPVQSTLYSAATRHANAVASLNQNAPGSAAHANANPFAQLYIGFGVQSVSDPSVASGLSPRDGFPTKPVNQWQAVPVRRQSAGAKTEITRTSDSPNKLMEGATGSPQNLNEQETQYVPSSGIKCVEEKSRQHVISEALESDFQPAPGVKDSTENQMNIFYGTADQCLAITRSNKRKSPTSKLLPWHKEVVEISVSFPDIRTDELEWAQATNRPMEVGNDAELLIAGRSLPRPRKRLLLTTHLMQKLLRPSPGTIFSKDAASAYESVTHIVARLSLGDACSMSSAGADPDSAGKRNTEEKMDVSSVVNNLSTRIKQLEDDLLRFDRRPSLVNVRVESQDLERFSVINRFAKFHSRPQPNPSDPFSSGPPKMYPQRYVTAGPMPKDISDNGLQCVSL
uniref:Uncharacterized protein n=1 Tax=Kalanchoe fedtschenkoi TaxID=63787 RepID=A0A7N0SYN7_KALFE